MDSERNEDLPGLSNEYGNSDSNDDLEKALVLAAADADARNDDYLQIKGNYEESSEEDCEKIETVSVGLLYDYYKIF